jgi:hypothetical protein
MLAAIFLTCRGLALFLPRFGPLGVLLRDQAFETFRENTVPVIATVRASGGEVEVLLVLEGFGGRAIQHPAGLPLIQLLRSLGNDDEGGERRGDRSGDLQCGDDRHRRADDELAELDPLVSLLGGDALAVILLELVLQPIPCRTTPVSWLPIVTHIVSASVAKSPSSVSIRNHAPVPPAGLGSRTVPVLDMRMSDHPGARDTRFSSVPSCSRSHLTCAVIAQLLPCCFGPGSPAQGLPAVSTAICQIGKHRSCRM